MHNMTLKCLRMTLQKKRSKLIFFIRSKSPLFFKLMIKSRKKGFSGKNWSAEILPANQNIFSRVAKEQWKTFHLYLSRGRSSQKRTFRKGMTKLGNENFFLPSFGFKNKNLFYFSGDWLDKILFSLSKILISCRVHSSFDNFAKVGQQGF